MWEIYDELINTIPKDIKIESFLAGLHWFLVRSSGTGMAMTPLEGKRSLMLQGSISGRYVHDVAHYIKSWDNFEAAIGLAAINSVVNTPGNILAISGKPPEEQIQINAFEYMKDEIAGRKVAVIGHFRDLENIAESCELTILERKPAPGDLPDPSCEYILPFQDYVFITATTLINKTLPRLLELSRNAYVILVGPSTPMHPCLFKYGIDMLAGTTVFDGRRVWNLIREGDRHRFFEEGASMVKIGREEVKRGY